MWGYPTLSAYSQYQFDGAKNWMLPTALSLPGDTSHRSILELDVQGLFLGLVSPMISKRFVKMGIIVCYRI